MTEDVTVTSINQSTNQPIVVFQLIPLDCFEGQSSDGSFVPIVAGGRSIPLTFANRREYADRAVEYRLHEFDKQVREQRHVT